ncbi:MAG: GNAT family N-acetyltransferase [Saprospiraceae bacterium]|nr:GNAT family N-acetyltransferase [Saprospiraceae bacterium]
MQGSEFRLAEVKDIPCIQQIAYSTWPKAFRSILSEEQISYMLEMMYSEVALVTQIIDKGHRFIIASINNEDVGFLSYETDFQGSCDTRIHKLYVLPKWHGKGMGQTLLNDLHNRVKYKAEALVLNVNKYNRAIHFYQNQGFEIIAEEVIEIGNGYVMDDYVMRKVIRIAPKL